MTQHDQRIGAAILTARSATTQQVVADAMRERGHKWSQSTVWSVEKGERPLRLSEANDLAQILGITITDLSSEPDELETSLLTRRYYDAYRGLVDATDIFFAVQEEIQAQREQVERGSRKLPEATIAELDRMASELPEHALSDARRRNAERLEHGDDDDAHDQHTQTLIDWERGK